MWTWLKNWDKRQYRIVKVFMFKDSYRIEEKRPYGFTWSRLNYVCDTVEQAEETITRLKKMNQPDEVIKVIGD